MKPAKMPKIAIVRDSCSTASAHSAATSATLSANAGAAASSP